jgi:hypothetical protein
MSSGKKNSPEFKSRVGYEAALSSKKMIAELAEKYKVSEKEIIEWAESYGGVPAGEEMPAISAEDHGHDDHHHGPEGEDYIVDVTDEDLFNSVKEGIQNDFMNYKMLTGWILIGIVTVIGLVIIATQLEGYTKFQKMMSAAGQTENLQVNQLEAEQQTRLNSYGVVDPDAGIYHVPIDSAINMMVNN